MRSWKFKNGPLDRTDKHISYGCGVNYWSAPEFETRRAFRPRDPQTGRHPTNPDPVVPKPLARKIGIRLYFYSTD